MGVGNGNGWRGWVKFGNVRFRGGHNRDEEFAITVALERAFEKASNLPVALQRELAKRLLAAITAAEQDRRDTVRARKALARFRAGKLKTVSHEKIKRDLGL
jgi:hypothetical protein